MNFQEITRRARELHREHNLLQNSEKLRFSPVAFHEEVVAPQLGGQTISVELKNVSAMGAYSVLLRYKDRAVVRISDSISPCWQKFCYVKELCHLLVDTEEEYELREKRIVGSARDARKIPVVLASGCEDPEIAKSLPGSIRELDSEQSSFLLALELVVPWEINGENKVREQMLRTGSPYDSLYPNADKAKVPLVLLELFREDYGVFSAGHYL